MLELASGKVKEYGHFRPGIGLAASAALDPKKWPYLVANWGLFPYNPALVKTSPSPNLNFASNWVP